MCDEQEFIRWLGDTLPEFSNLQPGIGDDAAVWVDDNGGDTVMAADSIAEGIHFDPGADRGRVGHKALAVNLSDLAAMAAQPTAALVSLVLNREAGFGDAQRIYEGLLPLAERYDLAIAGGDTNIWNGPLTISITALGRTTSHGPLLRSRAKPNDVIVVSGELGGSLLGKHLDFEPRVREALWLHANFALHAGMDISDGLLIDLQRMCDASGCGAVVDLDAVPIAPAAHAMAASSDKSAVQHASTDGEDFELLLACDAVVAEKMIQTADFPLTIVGRFEDQSGIRCRDDDGNIFLPAVTGYEHRFGE